jgi:hypothetical protein
MSLIYSVTVSIDDDKAEEWETWMQSRHIPDVMATGCFLNYQLFRLLEPAPEPGTQTFNIQYVCSDKAALDDYLENFADTLRHEHSRRYEGKFVAFRTVLEKRS